MMTKSTGVVSLGAAVWVYIIPMALI